MLPAMEVRLRAWGSRRVKALLLLHLFVTKAAADCLKPQGMGSIVLTDDSLLKNNFPEGLHITLKCANGYERESGSDIITCKNGEWSTPELVCKKKDCGLPKPQPNMSFNTSNGTLFGAVIKVSCDKGYQLIGSGYKQCYATGWSGKKAKCEIVRCDKPAAVINGRSSWDSEKGPVYRETIHYSCNDGYNLVGKENITCTETGRYDSQPPECRGVTTEDTVTTKMVKPKSTTPATEVSNSTDSPATTATAHRDQSITATATATVSLSGQGGRGIMVTEGKATTASVQSTTSLQDGHDDPVDTNTNVGLLSVIFGVVCILLAVFLVAFFAHRFLLKRKG